MCFQNVQATQIFFAHTLWLFASIKLVTEHAKEWLAISKYLLADACFSKKPFLDQVLQAGMHLVSRLRDAADLKYLHQGEKSPQKVDLNCMPER